MWFVVCVAFTGVLAAASNVTLAELPWIPAALDHAEDRLHRIGQRATSVNAWHWMTEDTIDRPTFLLCTSVGRIVEAPPNAARCSRPVAVAGSR